jgi:aerobic carbon-monoxide dehydrogenase small subunit
MTRLNLVLNGRYVVANVSARTSLADFVRDHEGLTGTHITCEQGICGACTLMIDGCPARSCITLAVACADSDVRTIEGFNDDEIMELLRRCFSENHALQCGYCTPGMLITAHDIVRRLPNATRERIRLELSGNLCRCTGYIGIINAIERALQRRRTVHAEKTSPLERARQ